MTTIAETLREFINKLDRIQESGLDLSAYASAIDEVFGPGSIEWNNGQGAGVVNDNHFRIDLRPANPGVNLRMEIETEPKGGFGDNDDDVPTKVVQRDIRLPDDAAKLAKAIYDKFKING